MWPHPTLPQSRSPGYTQDFASLWKGRQVLKLPESLGVESLNSYLPHLSIVSIKAPNQPGTSAETVTWRVCLVQSHAPLPNSDLLWRTYRSQEPGRMRKGEFCCRKSAFFLGLGLSTSISNHPGPLFGVSTTQLTRHWKF